MINEKFLSDKFYENYRKIKNSSINNMDTKYYLVVGIFVDNLLSYLGKNILKSYQNRIVALSFVYGAISFIVSMQIFKENIENNSEKFSNVGLFNDIFEIIYINNTLFPLSDMKEAINYVGKKDLEKEEIAKIGFKCCREFIRSIGISDKITIENNDFPIVFDNEVFKSIDKFITI